MRLAQREVGSQRTCDGGNAGREIQQQRAALREPGVDQERKVPDPVRDLVCGHGKGRQQPQDPVLEEGRGDQHPVQGVVDAVPDQDQHARGVRCRAHRVSVVVIMRV